MILWYALHRIVNALAWKFAKPSLREVWEEVPFNGWLWRVNDWVGDRYVPQYVARIMERERER